jgi:hypothetical protein
MINANALKQYYVYLRFESFVDSFQRVKSQKYTKLFLMMFTFHLYHNCCVLDSLWHKRVERLTRLHYNGIQYIRLLFHLKNYFNTLYHKNTQRYFEWCLQFIYIIIEEVPNLYDMKSVERLT